MTRVGHALYPKANKWLNEEKRYIKRKKERDL
jgi:hypothetical protein